MILLATSFYYSAIFQRSWFSHPNNNNTYRTNFILSCTYVCIKTLWYLMYELLESQARKRNKKACWLRRPIHCQWEAQSESHVTRRLLRRKVTIGGFSDSYLFNWYLIKHFSKISINRVNLLFIIKLFRYKIIVTH